ncbi:hypothetical protein HYDPIDRAFT_188250 [Hydnomerulius pinastri MD-312]|uniref:DUF7330 domain-containing protein n=1 Tax=Hydnomerulius pinastri MD-312 TaxID=994086 RepID=A0A0C9VZE4_9AGAM|nr:hypothetical protein HYDPIDRAFT_188250 [Hydnomerulius pinastri MD-312]
MIIAPDDRASTGPSGTPKELKDSEVLLEVEAPSSQVLNDPPPSYTTPPEPESNAEASSSASQRTFKTKPTNFLALSSEHSSIKGEFIIDPSMRIPASLLPPLSEGETEADRKNLLLNSKTGSISAEVWLLRSRGGNAFPEEKRKRTTIDLSSSNGSVSAQVQTIHGVAPFLMTIIAPHGTVKVSLPRSFQGLLTLSTVHGSVSLADNLSQNSTPLSQVDTARRYFVGDFSALDNSEWAGDELRIEGKHGSIRIKYTDDLADDCSNQGFFSRLFRY